MALNSDDLRGINDDVVDARRDIENALRKDLSKNVQRYLERAVSNLLEAESEFDNDIEVAEAEEAEDEDEEDSDE